MQVAEKNAFTDLVYFGNVSGTETNYSLIICECDCLRTLEVLQDSTKLARNDVFWHKERYRWKVSYQESFPPHDTRERVIVAIGTASSLAVWSDASSIDWRPFTIQYTLPVGRIKLVLIPTLWLPLHVVITLAMWSCILVLTILKIESVTYITNTII